jgi:hypothetical protein
MADTNQRLLVEIAADRATQEAAQPAQRLDSTGIFLANLPGWRNALVEGRARDLNTVIQIALP